MKVKKLIAILAIVVIFEAFFEIGLFVAYKPLESQQTQQRGGVEQKSIATANCSEEKTVTVIGVGVHDDNKTGELVKIRAKIRQGQGRIFFETTLHSYGIELQDSIQTVLMAVENYLGRSMSNEDFFINVNAEAHYIEGTSGGAAIAVALIALNENKTVRSDTAITGTIDDTGRIGEIAGLDVKIKTAKEYGLKRILIPKAQCPLAQDEQGINVSCVGTISEAVKDMVE